MKPTWKNTLNYEFGTYPAIIDILHAAAAVGYPFFTWHDGKVHAVSKEYSTKGVFKNLYITPTDSTIDMLDGIA